ncbi:unnamed protein product [Lampetra fluviatilis]
MGWEFDWDEAISSRHLRAQQGPSSALPRCRPRGHQPPLCGTSLHHSRLTPRLLLDSGHTDTDKVPPPRAVQQLLVRIEAESEPELRRESPALSSSLRRLQTSGQEQQEPLLLLLREGGAARPPQPRGRRSAGRAVAASVGNGSGSGALGARGLHLRPGQEQQELLLLLREHGLGVPGEWRRRCGSGSSPWIQAAALTVPCVDIAASTAAAALSAATTEPRLGASLAEFRLCRTEEGAVPPLTVTLRAEDVEPWLQARGGGTTGTRGEDERFKKKTEQVRILLDDLKKLSRFLRHRSDAFTQPLLPVQSM